MIAVGLIIVVCFAFLAGFSVRLTWFMADDLDRDDLTSIEEWERHREALR